MANKNIRTVRYFLLAGVSLGAVACATVPSELEYVICDDSVSNANCPDGGYFVEVE